MNTRGKRETLLFVDDEESILEIAQEYFEMKGYRVLTAANGREAIRVLERESIDCCFTDINMPEMNGLELAEYINGHDSTIPVIIMTGFPSLDSAIQTIKNGVVDFLIKPVNLNQMELCIRRVFQQQKLFVENVLLKGEVQRKKQLEALNIELEEKVNELNILNKIMRDITAIRTSSDVFRRVTEMTVEITHADEAVFYIANASMQRPAAVVASSPQGVRAGVGPAAPIDQQIEKLVMETVSDQIPLLVPGNGGSANLPRKMGSLMVVPLKIRDKTFGALTAATGVKGGHFNEKDLYFLSFMTHNAGYAIENLALYENIYENLFSTLYAFVKAIEARDPYTEQHSNRVTKIAMVIGCQMGCSEEELGILNTAGYLHDIGKIGIRDQILLKPAALTTEEFDVIKKHPVIGAEIVGHLGLWAREQEIIRYHHERFDGSGYPEGLKGRDIPLLSRILAVADVYDSLSSDRAYRKRMPENKILQLIDDSCGRHFDPDIVAAFHRVYEKGEIFSVLEGTQG